MLIYLFLLYSSDCSLTRVGFLRVCKHFRSLALLTSFVFNSYYHFPPPLLSSYLPFWLGVPSQGNTGPSALEGTGVALVYSTPLGGDFLLVISSCGGGVGDYHLSTWWCPPHVYLLTRALKEQAGEVSLPRLCGVSSSIPPADNRSGVRAPLEERGKYGLWLCWVERCNMEMSCLL